MPSLKRNFLYSSAYQVLLVVTPLVTTPLLSRTIGAEGNGAFTYTQAVANYFVMASALGLSNYGVRVVAECGEDRGRRSATFWEVMVMSAGVGLLVAAAYALYVISFGGAYRPLFALWGMWVAGSVADPSWLLFGCQEFRTPTIRSFCTRLASVAFILSFVRDAGDTWAYVAAIAGAYLLNSALLWPFVGRYVDWARPTLKGALSHLAPNFALFVPVLATSLYTLLDKVMLEPMAGAAEVGLFDYAEKISKMPLSVITALGSVVLPRMSAMMAEGRVGEGKALVHDTMWFMQACAMALSFGIAAVAPEFCPLFFGEGYSEVVALMRVLCAVIPLICATNVIGVQYLLPCHRDRDFTASVLSGAAVDAALNLILIPRLGAMGAAVATVAAEVAVLAVQAYMVKGDLPLAGSLSSALPFVAAGTAMLAIVRIASPILPDGWAGFGLEFLIGATSYLTIAYGWCWLTKSAELERVLPIAAPWAKKVA